MLDLGRGQPNQWMDRRDTFRGVHAKYGWRTKVAFLVCHPCHENDIVKKFSEEEIHGKIPDRKGPHILFGVE